MSDTERLAVVTGAYSTTSLLTIIGEFKFLSYSIFSWKKVIDFKAFKAPLGICKYIDCLVPKLLYP
jgi:hypothetical protein